MVEICIIISSVFYFFLSLSWQVCSLFIVWLCVLVRLLVFDEQETSKFLIWFSVLTVFIVDVVVFAIAATVAVVALVGSLLQTRHRLHLIYASQRHSQPWRKFFISSFRIAIKFSRFGALLPSFIVKYQSI